MQWQLDWIYFLHNFRSAFLDHWFIFLNIFDRQEFFFVMIPLLWLGVKWKWGVRFFYLFMCSDLLNFTLKMIFMTPRPFHLDPSVALIYVSGPGFPSGGAQTAILIAGLILKEWKKGFWTRFAAINFFFWVSLSRLYLGVHFPMDILGGWLVGLFLLILYYKADPRIESWAKKKSWSYLFCWVSLFSLLPPIFLHDSMVYLVSGASVGVMLSLYLASKWHLLLDPKSRKEGALRALIGIGGLFPLAFFLQPLVKENGIFQVALSLGLGIWIGCGVPWIWKKIRPIAWKTLS
jgi:membrane-associated phospholipid phosphatase